MKHPPSSPLEFNSTLECFPFFASPVGPSDFDNLDEDRQKANKFSIFLCKGSHSPHFSSYLSQGHSLCLRKKPENSHAMLTFLKPFLWLWESQKWLLHRPSIHTSTGHLPLCCWVCVTSWLCSFSWERKDSGSKKHCIGKHNRTENNMRGYNPAYFPSKGIHWVLLTGNS